MNLGGSLRTSRDYVVINTDGNGSTLEKRSCWQLLETAEVGRLAVTIHGQPEIFPVNYVVDHGSVVFRTAAGTKLATIRGAAVAFEVDGVDPNAAVAWSVVLKGRAEEIKHSQELAFAAELPLHPWHGSAKPHVVRIVPHEISGRRFRIAVSPQESSHDEGLTTQT